MSRVKRRALAISLGAVLTSIASLASADDVGKLRDQLLSSDDFRVRTQAALALGASKNKKAVDVLCKGLDDASTTVRIAAAAALGKLKLGGTSCLEKRLDAESNGGVKSSIKKSLALMKSGERPEPVITGSTKYYVAIGKTTDKTGRNGDGVDGIVRDSMEKAASSLNGCVVAPEKESASQAKQKLDKWKRVKGFYLLPKVTEPSYANGNLVVKLEVAIFTYPNKALKGSIPIKLTQSDVGSKDQSAEDELIKMAAERAVEKFAQNAERIE